MYTCLCDCTLEWALYFTCANDLTTPASLMTSTYKVVVPSLRFPPESLWLSKSAYSEEQSRANPKSARLLIPGANLQTMFPQHPSPWGGEGGKQMDQVMAFSAWK